MIRSISFRIKTRRFTVVALLVAFVFSGVLLSGCGGCGGEDNAPGRGDRAGSESPVVDIGKQDTGLNLPRVPEFPAPPAEENGAVDIGADKGLDLPSPPAMPAEAVPPGGESGVVNVPPVAVPLPPVEAEGVDKMPPEEAPRSGVPPIPGDTSGRVPPPKTMPTPPGKVYYRPAGGLPAETEEQTMPSPPPAPGSWIGHVTFSYHGSVRADKRAENFVKTKREEESFDITSYEFVLDPLLPYGSRVDDWDRYFLNRGTIAYRTDGKLENEEVDRNPSDGDSSSRSVTTWSDTRSLNVSVRQNLMNRILVSLYVNARLNVYMMNINTPDLPYDNEQTVTQSASGTARSAPVGDAHRVSLIFHWADRITGGSGMIEGSRTWSGQDIADGRARRERLANVSMTIEDFDRKVRPPADIDAAVRSEQCPIAFGNMCRVVPEESRPDVLEAWDSYEDGGTVTVKWRLEQIR